MDKLAKKTARGGSHIGGRKGDNNMTKPLTAAEKRILRTKRETDMLKRMSQPPKTWEEKESERLERKADRLLGPPKPKKKRYCNMPKQAINGEIMTVNGVIITDKEKIAQLERLLHYPKKDLNK